MPEAKYTADEMMTIAAARMIRNGASCFVGIGLPSAAANLARLTHAPDTILIYESGCIGTKPTVLPLSIGDGELSETAEAVVSIPEIFAYWLQGGRIDLGFLGAAQIDRFANINTTVIGDYRKPTVRLPGAGGAPEIAASSKEVLITLRQNKRAFVDKLDFVTSGGHFSGGDSRVQMGLPGKGPTAVITDLGILTPDPTTKELTLTSVHPGVTVERVVEATGWPLKVAAQVTTTQAPNETELTVLRDLNERTARAHAGEA
ncbi:MAG TPA: CoA-transferase subunit beta [Bryobacteraceae bacterium]|nr:CoA-transferase subunit beta [Bryobacteraceae bacterium]HUO30020.1 CoA-transferase subunit beta [Bryobacteraceae bacterium]